MLVRSKAQAKRRLIHDEVVVVYDLVAGLVAELLGMWSRLQICIDLKLR